MTELKVQGQRQVAPVPVLDASHLASLEVHLGAPEMRELMADGMIELADRLGRLADCEEPRAISALAHDISGIAGQIGMSRLAHEAALVSRAAATGGDPSQARASLMEHRDESFRMLRAWLDRRRLTGP